MPGISDGTEKYRIRRGQLQPDEFVYVECGHDAEKYGIS